jgi:hypothetical protein
MSTIYDHAAKVHLMLTVLESNDMHKQIPKSPLTAKDIDVTVISV